jgi:hypothetical protein
VNGLTWLVPPTIEADAVFYLDVNDYSQTVPNEKTNWNILLFRKDEKFGILDADGNIRHKAEYMGYCIFPDGSIFIDGAKDNNDWIWWRLKDDLSLVYDRAMFYLGGIEYIYDRKKSKAFVRTIGEGASESWNDAPTGIISVVSVKNGEPGDGLHYEPTGKYGILKDGKVVVSPKYASANPFSEGLAAFKNDKGKWGYLSGAI